MDRTKSGGELFSIDDRGFNVKAWYLENTNDSKGDAIVELRYNDKIIREIIFPAYKIYNIAAHFSDVVDGEINNSDRGYAIAASDGLGGFAPVKDITHSPKETAENAVEHPATNAGSQPGKK